jgi:hypothetical protein
MLWLHLFKGTSKTVSTSVKEYEVAEAAGGSDRKRQKGLDFTKSVLKNLYVQCMSKHIYSRFLLLLSLWEHMSI